MEQPGNNAGHPLGPMKLTNISRSFGDTLAVADVSLEIARGEIVALVGENGAGKTTLMRIASGELAADSGTVEREGNVALVHQHFVLVPELTIAENLALGAKRGFRFVTRRALERAAREIIDATHLPLPDVGRLVGSLSVGEKSRLELIKAIARKPDTLILDEPTSVLTPAESAELFEVMRRLATAGTSIVFISHKLPEVLAVAHRIVVMRNGRTVAALQARDATAERLAQAMTEIPIAGKAATAGAIVRERTQPPLFTHEGLAIWPGEIVAVVGVAGNGQNDLATALRDRLDRASSGHIPEDRTRDGVVATMTIAENLALRSRSYRRSEAERHARQMIDLYSIRAAGPRQLAGDLSGGNQQKVILARELDPRPRAIVAAEPTRGLDLASTRFVHDQLRAAVGAGAGVLLITSDLDEAFALANGFHVIYRGRLSERLEPAEARERVAGLMAGVA